MEDEVNKAHEPTLTDFLKEWLIENKIEVYDSWTYYLDDTTTVAGFGWRILISKLKISFINKLNDEVLDLSAADPTAFDQLKSKILFIENGAMSYMAEHIDDDYKLPPPKPSI